MPAALAAGLAGEGEGLDALRKMLSARSNRSRAARTEEAVPTV